MIHQMNWGMWYTKNKFKYLPLLPKWTLDWIWATILAYNVKFVVISEWEDYHPFYMFEESKYTPNLPILWSYVGTVEFRTTIYAVKL